MLRRYYGKISKLPIEDFAGHDGELVVDDVTGKVYVMDGFTNGGTELVGATPRFGVNPPINPTPGTMWYDPNNGRTYIYFQNTWVDAAPNTAYILPAASTTVLGGIKVGNNLSIDQHGVLNAEDGNYTLPVANATVLGGVKIGSGININNGVISVPEVAFDNLSNLSNVSVEDQTFIPGNVNLPISFESNLHAYSFDSPIGIRNGSGFRFIEPDDLSGDYVSGLTHSTINNTISLSHRSNVGIIINSNGNTVINNLSTANILIGNVDVYGSTYVTKQIKANIGISGGYGFANQSKVSSNANITYSSFDNDIKISNASKSWSFDLGGNLTIPGNINYANGLNILNSIASNINLLLSNSNTQTSNINLLFSNASSQATNINLLFSNASSQTIEINNLWSNAGVQSDIIGYLVANAESQSLLLSSIETNGGNIITSSIAPVDPIQGKLWYDTESGKIFVYLNDAWVDTTPSMVLDNQSTEINNIINDIIQQTTEINDLWSTIDTQNSIVGSLIANAEEQGSILSSLNANAGLQATAIHGLRSDVNVLLSNSNAAVQATEINNLWSNAGIQANAINNLWANAAVQGNVIGYLVADSNLQSNLLTSLNSNAVVQANAINNLVSNVNILLNSSNAAIQSTEINDLWANAETQANEIDNLWANATIQGNIIGYLVANSEAQDYELTSLKANAAIQANAIIDLRTDVDDLLTSSNAAVQADAINNLWTNAETQANEIINLWANAEVQGNIIGYLVANSEEQSSLISSVNSNVAIQANAIIDLRTDVDNLISNNTGETNSQINDLWANAALQLILIDQLSSNAGVQGSIIGNLVSNTEAQGSLLLSLNANAAIQANAIIDLRTDVDDLLTSSNAAVQADAINNLWANAETQANEIIDLWANAETQSSIIGSLVANSTNGVIPLTSTAPLSPDVGQLWYDTNSGKIFVYISDAWVDTSPLIPLAGNAPVNASSFGVPGQIAYDISHVYICVAHNTWKRANLSTW